MEEEGGAAWTDRVRPSLAVTLDPAAHPRFRRINLIKLETKLRGFCFPRTQQARILQLDPISAHRLLRHCQHHAEVRLMVTGRTRAQARQEAAHKTPAAVAKSVRGEEEPREARELAGGVGRGGSSSSISAVIRGSFCSALLRCDQMRWR